MSSSQLSAEDEAFLAECEEEFKHRYTDKDEEFMKVHNAEPSMPPIMESWWVPQNSGRRNDRRHNRRHHPVHPYEKNNRDYRGNQRDYNNDNRDQGYHNHRSRYY